MCFPKSLYEDQQSTKEPAKLQDKHNVFNECLPRTQFMKTNANIPADLNQSTQAADFALGEGVNQASLTSELQYSCGELDQRSKSAVRTTNTTAGAKKGTALNS
jgi:hypothetical protein